MRMDFQPSNLIEQVWGWVVIGIAGLAGGVMRRHEDIKGRGEPFWSTETLWGLLVALAMGWFTYGLTFLVEMPDIVRISLTIGGSFLGPRVVFQALLDRLTKKD